MKRALLFLCIAIATFTQLFAIQRNIVLIDDDQLDLLEIQPVVKQCFKYDFRDDASSVNHRESVRLQVLVNDIGKELDKAYKEENLDLINQTRQRLQNPQLKEDDSIFISNFTDSVSDSGLYGAVSQNDNDYIDAFMKSKGHDLMIFITSSKINDLLRLRVFVYEQKLDKVYEHICLESEQDFDEAEVVASLVPYFYPADCSLLVLDEGISNIKTVDFYGRYAVVRPGIYESEDSSQLIVEPSQILHLKGQPEVMKSSSILITSSMDDVSLFSNGKMFGKAPLVLDDLEAPFSIIARADGYKPVSFLSSGNDSSCHFDMKPSWVGDKSMYDKARKDFYWSFASTLFLFGANVFLSSMESQKTGFKAAGLAVSGGLAISLVDLFFNLMDYYRTSINISL